MAQQCGTCHVLDGLTLRIPFGPVSVVCAPEVEILEFPKKSAYSANRKISNYGKKVDKLEFQ